MKSAFKSFHSLLTAHFRAMSDMWQLLQTLDYTLRPYGIVQRFCVWQGGQKGCLLPSTSTPCHWPCSSSHCKRAILHSKIAYFSLKQVNAALNDAIAKKITINKYVFNIFTVCNMMEVKFEG